MSLRLRSRKDWGRLGMISKQLPLYDLAEWKNGLAFRKIDFSNKGKPVIKIAELKNGITGQTQFTNGNYGEAVSLTRGDMVFSWSGNPETSIDVFWYDLPDGWLNQHIFKVTPSECVDKKYLYYLLKSLKPTFTAIASNKQTTGLGHVTIKDLKELIIDLPTRSTQEAISNYLYALDSKIHLNKQLNDNLQQQAHAIYVSMFITNADPSWQQGHLSDLVIVKYGKDHKKLADGNYPVYGSGGIMRYVECPLYDQESVLIPRKGTLNNVIYVNQPFWSVDTMFYTEMRLPNVAKFVYHFVKSKDLASMNTGSAVPSMTTDILNAMEVVIPSAAALEEFERIVSPMYKEMQENDKQSTALGTLRDILLPKLMSGEIDVSSIQL